MRTNSNKLLLLLSFVFFFLYSAAVQVFATAQYGPDNVDLDPTCAYTDITCTVGQMEFFDEGLTITNEPISIDFTGAGVDLTEGLDGVLTVTIPGGSGSPGGADTNIQFNNAGAFDGSSDFIWNDALKIFEAGDHGLGNSTLLVVDDNGSIITARTPGGMFEAGDISGAINGNRTTFRVDDSSQDIDGELDGSFTIRNASNGSDLAFYSNFANREYSMGDINSAVNGTYVSVNDTTQTIVAQAQTAGVGGRLGVDSAGASVTYNDGVNAYGFAGDALGGGSALITANGTTWIWPNTLGNIGEALVDTTGTGVLGWSAVSDGIDIGDDVTGGTEGAVLFVDSGDLAEDPNNFFWDDSSDFLGIGTDTPGFPLDVNGVINTATEYDIAGEFFATQDTSINLVRIGQNAGNGTMNGNANTIIGNNAGNDLTSGVMNLFAGANAGQATTSGGGNVFLGPWAGFNNIDGGMNVFVGQQSGELNSSGTGNTYLGYYAGNNAVSGFNNTFVGINSGQQVTTGDYNTFLGMSAGKNTTSAGDNVYIGREAGMGAALGSTATENVSIGSQSGISLTTGSANVFMGTYSGYENEDGQENVFIGRSSGGGNTTGDKNTFLGANSGLSSITGLGNVFLGYDAGYNQDEDYQVAIGYQALKGATSSTGATNSVVGYKSGFAVTSGASNAFLGYETGVANTTGSGNVFLGYIAGQGNTTGGSNVYIGQQAGQFVTTASNNVYIGTTAGQPSSGSDNVFVGSFAGVSSTTGGTNTYIGMSAGYVDIANSVTTVDGLTNATALGYKAQVGTSNSLVLGGMGTNAVNVGIGNITPAYRLDIVTTSDGIVASFNDSDSGSCTVDPGDGDFSCSSDVRLKRNIDDLESSLDMVRSLRPVRYNWNSDEDGDPTNIGFIAQEVDEVLPEFVTTYNDGYLGLNYAGFTPVLTKAIQELDITLIDIQEFTDEKFISKLQEWLGSVTNGLEKLYAGKVETYEIQTEKLCVGSRCITESEFIELLDSNNIGNVGEENIEDDQEEIVSEIIIEEENSVPEEGEVLEEEQIDNNEEVEIISEEETEEIPEEIQESIPEEGDVLESTE